MSTYTLEITTAPDTGFTARMIRVDGESAYRQWPDGHWSYCGAHKGPWVGVNAINVPREILRKCAEARDTQDAGEG